MTNLFFRLPALLLLLASAAALAQPQVNRKYKETLVGPFPKEVQATAIFSPDGMRAAWIRDGNTVFLDGKPQKPYAKVAALTFSRDAKWLAYAASDGNKWFLVVGDRQEAPFQRVGEPTFSYDSRRIGYVALQDNGSRVVVVNSKLGAPCDEVFDGRVFFSQEGDHVAYGARKGQKWHVVLDGQESPPADFLGSATGLQFSPDGKRLGYAALHGRSWRIVAGAKDQPAWVNVADLALHPQEDRLAYAALKNGKWRVVVDGKEEKSYDAIGEGTLRWSRNGRHLAYAAQQAGKWLVVADGVEGKPYDAVSPLRWSNNGRRLAYVIRSGPTQMVVEIEFGENSTQKTRAHRLFDRVGGNTLVFSPNSERVGYIARSGRATFALIDGKRKPRYDMIGYLTFSPDNRRFVYAATRGDKAFTVVDEAEAAHQYTIILNPPDTRLIFDTRKRFHYMAVKDGNLYLVEEDME